jgi:20S proteasome alpha/beta subunit
MIAPKPRTQFGIRQIERLRRMTVAAGYICDEGVILCADTQETIPGYTKTDANKLMSFNLPDLCLVFAGAGNNAVQIDETVHEIAGKFRSSAPTNGEQIRKALREILEELFPKAHYPRQSGPEVDLLMAVQSVDAVQLFRVSDGSIAPVHHTACIGSGVVLGTQLFQRYYNKDVSLFDAALISIYVLFHVKRWVDGCGGKTDISLIQRTGGRMSFMPSDEVEKLEKYCESYDDAVIGLLTATPRNPKDRAAFDTQVEVAKQKLIAARTSFQDWEDLMREVAAQLGMSYEAFMNDVDEKTSAFLKT